MSKAILVIDMPTNCVNCGYCHTRPYDNKNKIDGEKFCGILNEDVEVYYYHSDGRPEFCPLKPLSEKQEISKYFGSCMNQCCTEWEKGYNSCINDIIGENT